MSAVLELDHAAIAAYTTPPQENADGYHGQSRPEMQVYVPADTRRLLDIGCSSGHFAAAVKARTGCEAWGVEIEPSAASDAATRLDRILNEPFSANTDLPEGYFDVVTMNDTLEHIENTNQTLVAAKRALRPGGLLILSLPNVAFYVHNYRLLMQNNWDYQNDGILDRTHVRFFTADSIAKILTANGYKVEMVRGLPTARPTLKWRIIFALFPKMTYWWRFFQIAVAARA